MPLTTREVALVARSGGAEMGQAVAVALALPLGGCDVFLVLEGAARELATQPETQDSWGPDGMWEQMEALLSDDGVEVVVRWDAGDDPALVARLRPQVRSLGADEIEARCRQAHHWLVM
jgi:hypothetical protein